MLSLKNIADTKYKRILLAVAALLLVSGFMGYPKKISKRFLSNHKTAAVVIKKHTHKRLAHIKFPIRAAFYDPTDTVAYQSLVANIGKVNMLISDAFFIDPANDSVRVKHGSLGRKLIEKSGVTSLALLSNFYGGRFDGASLHRIFNDSAKTAKVIGEIIKSLQANHFAGVNIDFEELQEDTNRPLVAFEKALYQRMHAQGLIVTIDVIPFNDDYNTKELAKYDDQLFLMAYDQFNDSSAPGPVSSLSWIKKVLAEQTRKLPANKVVLCIAGYGYDWAEYSSGKSVSYKEAIRIAAGMTGNVILDDSTFNPHFTYKDASSKMHYVQFTSARTNMEAMQLASGKGAAGVALWRLGTEDSRVWSFFNNQLPMTSTLTDSALNIRVVTESKVQNQSVGFEQYEGF